MRHKMIEAHLATEPSSTALVTPELSNPIFRSSLLSFPFAFDARSRAGSFDCHGICGIFPRCHAEPVEAS